MSKIVLDTKSLQILSLFESLSRAQVKDCVQSDDQIIIIVEQGEIGKAIGTGGRNVREMERLMKKRVKLVEFNSNLEQFIRNVVYPLNIAEVSIDDSIVSINAKDLKTRGLLIGRNASHLRFFEGIIQRYFPIKEIKVL